MRFEKNNDSDFCKSFGARAQFKTQPRKIIMEIFLNFHAIAVCIFHHKEKRVSPTCDENCFLQIASILNENGNNGAGVYFETE